MAKKSRKTAERSGQAAHEYSAAKLLTVSNGHVVQSLVSMVTKCGQKAFQWRYGVVEDAFCEGCIKEES